VNKWYRLAQFKLIFVQLIKKPRQRGDAKMFSARRHQRKTWTPVLADPDSTMNYRF
jgi:hypothetical protein